MEKYTIQCVEKPFSELTKEDIRFMRRSFPRIELDEFYGYYSVDAKQYAERIKELGFSWSREERANSVKVRDVLTPLEQPTRPLSKIEMAAIRLFRGYSRSEFAKKLGISEMMVQSYEKGRSKPKKAIESRYILIMKITTTELKRIRMVLSGEVEGIEVERDIPDVIKRDVYKKYNGQCGKCGDKRKLHYHHIKHFSDGGLHHIDNLILLCVMCHAGEHKDEHVFRMLMSIAEKLEKECETA